MSQLIAKHEQDRDKYDKTERMGNEGFNHVIILVKYSSGVKPD